MKCSNEKCQNDAVYKIIHLGTKEVPYCVNCLQKYQSIMNAMGSPTALVYPIEDLEEKS